MKIPFKKMSGAGNDFIVVDNRDGMLPLPIQRVVAIACERSTAWHGADGFIAIVPAKDTEFEMLYFNADGTTGAMCGNGGRCAARFALTEHIAKKGHMTFDAVGNRYVADVEGSRVKLAMPPPRAMDFNRTMSVMGRSITYHYVNVETPHAVIFLDDMHEPKLESLGDLDITAWGPAVRMHPALAPEGANANFVRIKDNGMVVLRTYERGVEGETLACGTGSVATALTAHFIRGVKPPVRVATASGETLVVDFVRDGESVRELTLEGSAVFEEEGELEV